MLKEGSLVWVPLYGIQREMVDKDPPLVVFAMSSHNQRDQAPRQKHPMLHVAAVDDLKASPARIDYDLDRKGRSYEHSAILRRLHLIEDLRGTMDDETGNAEAVNRVLRWDQST